MKLLKQSLYDGKPFLSIKEAAELTGLSCYYLRAEIRAGRIRAIQSGTKYLVNVPRLLESLDALPASRG